MGDSVINLGGDRDKPGITTEEFMEQLREVVQARWDLSSVGLNEEGIHVIVGFVGKGWATQGFTIAAKDWRQE